MAWLYVMLAGIFEVAMATMLKKSEGFSVLMPTIWFAITGAISFWLLSLALKTLPVGTAYAVWTGIGAAGTALVGIMILKEPASVLRLLSIVLIISGVVGLKLAANE